MPVADANYYPRGIFELYEWLKRGALTHETAEALLVSWDWDQDLARAASEAWAPQASGRAEAS